MKNFKIPNIYRSSFITRIKNSRKDSDPRKKDFTPTLLDLGTVRSVSYTHLRAHETVLDLVCRLLLEKKK